MIGFWAFVTLPLLYAPWLFLAGSALFLGGLLSIVIFVMAVD